MAEDMFTMQQEAIRRAREMHSRAVPRSGDSREGSSTSAENNGNTHGSNAANTSSASSGGNTPAGSNGSPGAIPSLLGRSQGDPLSLLFRDKDKTIILALILLLSGEDGDQSLLLALLYLLI